MFNLNMLDLNTFDITRLEFRLLSDRFAGSNAHGNYRHHQLIFAVAILGNGFGKAHSATAFTFFFPAVAAASANRKLVAWPYRLVVEVFLFSMQQARTVTAAVRTTIGAATFLAFRLRFYPGRRLSGTKPGLTDGRSQRKLWIVLRTRLHKGRRRD